MKLHSNSLHGSGNKALARAMFLYIIFLSEKMPVRTVRMIIFSSNYKFFATSANFGTLSFSIRYLHMSPILNHCFTNNSPLSLSLTLSVGSRSPPSRRTGLRAGMVTASCFQKHPWIRRHRLPWGLWLLRAGYRRSC